MKHTLYYIKVVSRSERKLGYGTTASQQSNSTRTKATIATNNSVVLVTGADEYSNGG